MFLTLPTASAARVRGTGGRVSSWHNTGEIASERREGYHLRLRRRSYGECRLEGHGRKPRSGEEEHDGSYFATLGARDGGIFAGSFDGDSEWERHRNGDEIVQILDGETEVEIITEDGPRLLHMTAGMLVVVPQGCWHRFHAPKGVTLMTVTPQPTDHTTEEDPGPN